MTFLLVTLCFACSGFAALVYQTAWTRQFSLVFGTSELSIAVVLAAYMAGLALGARLVDRYLTSIRRPVLVYGALELGIGATALAVPWLLLVAERVMLALIGGQAEPPASDGWRQTAFQVVAAFAVLGMPTAMMGATLPLLTRHAVHTTAQIAARTGLLYAVNALAGAAGALTAATVLLPALGLTRTVTVAAAVNVLVFGLAIVATRARPSAIDRHDTPTTRSDTWRPDSRSFPDWDAGARWILPVMLVSGAVSFAYEVLWTRMLGFVLGGSLQAFATMVASVLIGIAVGSLVASRLAPTRERASAGFIACQLSIAVSSAGVYLVLPALLPAHTGLAGNWPLALGVLLPASLCFGATFPLAVRILTGEPERAASAAARVFAWNTAGGIAGALLAGFVLIPALRFEGSIQVAVSMNLALAVFTTAVVARARLAWSAGVLLASAALVLLFRPAVPQQLLRASPLNLPRAGQMLFYDVGRSASVVVLEQDGALALRTNGLPESLVATRATTPKLLPEHWLSALAVIARPHAEDVLVVGYGGGSVIEALAPGVRRIDVIELEPAVIDANVAIADRRARDPLLDPRVTIVLNDARAALALTTRTYHAIISQPSHPWTAGASHLYTREFMQRAHDRLRGDGVFVQWMGASFLDETLLRSLAATMLEVFDHVRLYRPDPTTLVFLASDVPLDVERAALATDSALTAAPAHFARLGIRAPEDVVVALAADHDGLRDLAGDAPAVTDDRNRMAAAHPYDRGRGLDAPALSRILQVHDPLMRADSIVHAAGADRWSFGYMARRMALLTASDPTIPSRVEAMGALLTDRSMSAYVRGVAAASAGDARLARQRQREALALDPGNDAARYELVRTSLGALVRGVADADVVEAANGLPAPAKTLIEAGRLSVDGDWQAIAALDAPLAAVAPTAPWYVDCVQMRADWRIRGAAAGGGSRLGREALAIVDAALVSHAGLAMFGLRAQSAVAAGRPDVLLEAIADYARTVGRLPQVGDADVPVLTATLETWLRMLDDMRARPDGERPRLAEVRRVVVAARDGVRQRPPR